MEMTEGPLVSVRDLTYWYPETSLPALEDVNLEFGPGEFVLLVGSSGSGKSTLLRALNGLVPRYHGGRYRGRVEVDGVVASGGPSSQLAATVGLVFQDPERQSVMSRVDNEVAFGLVCVGTPSDEIGPRVTEALGSVGLADRASDMVSELSSGQAQRLALADVLAMGPRVLALDEPTSQLDPGAAEEFLKYLDRERRRAGTTVLLAEHRLDRGLQMADRVVVLSKGRVVLDGTPSEFLNDGWSSGEEVPTPTLAEVFREHGPVPKGPEEAGRLLRDLLSLGRLEIVRDRGSPPGETLVGCQDVHFAYQPGSEVLRGADLDIHAGEVLVLVGPNGSGKTTLARHLNGLLRPSKGRVLIDGEETSELPVARLSGEVALLTQNARPVALPGQGPLGPDRGTATACRPGGADGGGAPRHGPRRAHQGDGHLPQGQPRQDAAGAGGGGQGHHGDHPRHRVRRQGGRQVRRPGGR